MERRRSHIGGVVQGVGFRPHVYGLAVSHNLTGFVGNDSSGVFLEVQGETEELKRFLAELQAAPPPLARIDSIRTDILDPTSIHDGFRILDSRPDGGGHTSISPDSATCGDCLREMLDATDRRYRYPFINCTNCGPRFTIIKRTPYDRPWTTMAGFTMCPECQREYDSPANRRFHAQPNACPVCGPQLEFGGESMLVSGEDALQSGLGVLAQGEILAIKGIGGFHLAVDARKEDAVLRLRERKGRWGKPLAVMVRDLEMAERFAEISAGEAALMASPQRPIVLLAARRQANAFPLARQISPGTNRVGVMLPYSGLHTLLMEDSGPLAMTSGNLSNEPIVWRNEEARERLAGIADGFLLHDREIHVPCDDSVVRIVDVRQSPIRRSRGYAPLPVRLPRGGPSVLAVGAELKSTFCLTHHDHAYLSQHLGDMETLETLSAFERSVDHFQAIFRTKPEMVVCDLHPGYLSSSWARSYIKREGLPLVEVQHHHSHVCSAMAEHGLGEESRILGVVFDGTGYGTDGAIWGGEILLAGYDSFERILHLGCTPMPGGDSCIRNPYRMALAHLWSAGIAWDPRIPCVAAATANELGVLEQQLRSNLNCVPTSSVGRFFDAAASILGVRQRVEYEAQAAVELEALADESRDAIPYPILIAKGEIDPKPVIWAMVEDQRAGVPIGAMASRFQRTVAEIVVSAARRARRDTDVTIAALTGGVFQNATVAAMAAFGLRNAGFQVLEQSIVPANDGGVALGQAAIGLARSR
jgi:hydrogenase maturation protein HypF